MNLLFALLKLKKKSLLKLFLKSLIQPEKDYVCMQVSDLVPKYISTGSEDSSLLFIIY